MLFSLYASPGDDLALAVSEYALSGLCGLCGLCGFDGFYGFSRPSDISNNLVKAFIVVGYR